MKKIVLAVLGVALAISSSRLRADSVLTTITVGSQPAGIAVNFFADRIYVAVDAAEEVAVINGRTQKVISTINLGPGNTIAVAVNVFTDRVYATSCDFRTASCHLVVINGRTNAIVASIPIASGAFIGLQGVAVNPITDRIYVSDADNQQYIVIDGVTNSIIAQVPVFTQPAGIAVNLATNRVYLGSEGFPGGILVFNGRTNTFEGQIQEAGGVEAVVASFFLNRVYAAVGGPDSSANGSVAIVNGADFQLLADVPAGPFPHGIDVNLLNNRVYVANANGPSVTIIDGISGEVLQTLPIPARFVDSVAVNPVTGLTYVSDFESDQVIVLRRR